MYYAQAAQGFRPGSLDDGSRRIARPTLPTACLELQLGAKTTLARGVYLDLAGYRIDWDNLGIGAHRGRRIGLRPDLQCRRGAGVGRGADVGEPDARPRGERRGRVHGREAVGGPDQRLRGGDCAAAATASPTCPRSRRRCRSTTSGRCRTR
ncbi:hypothetical protein AB5I41_11390 [Sphingomonas sp. MMS24-JH45]